MSVTVNGRVIGEYSARLRPAVCGGFTEEQLRAAFEAVQNPNDWRAPIDAFVAVDAAAVTFFAIVYFTATEPTFKFNPQHRKLHVTADGYRNGPAGP